MIGRYLICILAMTLAACAQSKSGSPGNGTGEVGKPRPVPPEFKVYLSDRQTDCAGARETHNSIRLAFSTGTDRAADIDLALEPDGQYNMEYLELFYGNTTIRKVHKASGRWDVSGNAFVLTGPVQAKLSIAFRDSGWDWLKVEEFHFPQASNLPSPGLRLHTYRNADSRIRSCSPADNSSIVVTDGKYKIDGLQALAFWKIRLYMDWYGNGEVGSSVGDYREANSIPSASHHLNLKVFPNGTYSLKRWTKVDDSTPLSADKAGTWKLVEGLIVLEGLGVISPAQQNGFVVPILYFTHDPSTGVKVTGKYPSADISAWGN